MEAVTVQQFDSVADIRQHLRRGGQIYQQLRVYCKTTGTQTHMVPVPDDELEEYLLMLEIEELLSRPEIQEALRQFEMEEALMIREMEESLRSFEANGIQPFNVVECMRIRIGDLNGDGRITADDADLLSIYISGRGHTLPASVQARIAGGAGHIIGNPTISGMDLVWLNAYIAGRDDILPPAVQARLAWHPLRIGDLTGNATITMMDVELLRIYVIGMGHTLPDIVLERIDEGAGHIAGTPTITGMDLVWLSAYVTGNQHLLPPHVKARLSWHPGRDISPFTYTRIRCSGRPLSDSIVIMLLSDGFAANQKGRWPNPAQNTVLWHAREAMNSMIGTHPFSLFQDLFTVYVIHTHGVGPNGTSYLHTVADGNIAVGIARQYRIRQLANAIVPQEYQRMLQIISNATDTWPNGFAFPGNWMLYPQHGAPPLFRDLTIAVTSINNNTNPIIGGNLGVWQNGTLWHAILIHEFGHSFGGLTDERLVGVKSNQYANSTNEPNDALVKWRHWFGQRSVSSAPRRFIFGNWAVSALECLMSDFWMDYRHFCGVCTAELIRRLAFVVDEPFFGQSPHDISPYYVIPTTTRITLPSGTHRILDSSFHGNRYVRELDIPASVTEIGDFAFIGATGLRTIISRNQNPPQINNTTFHGVNRAQITVQVPPGRRTAYINAGWTGFNIVDRITGF